MATRTWIGTTSGDWSVTTNWVEGAVPIAGDDVFIANNAVDISAGLNQSAVTLASLTIDKTFTGKIGTATAYLRIGATVATIGNPSNGILQAVGSQRIKIDFGTVATAVTVVDSNTQTSAEPGLPPVRLIGTSTSNTYTGLGGRVGWAIDTPGETSYLASLKLDGANANVVTGNGCTMGTILLAVGTLKINSGATTINQYGGNLTTQTAGAISTLTIAGTAKLNSPGTISILNVLNGGVADFTASPTARTVSTANTYAGSTILDPFGVVTFTNGIQLQQCKVKDLQGLDVGFNKKLTIS